MSVSIRLAKIGKKFAPTYKVVATTTRNKRTGKYLDILGTFNPNVKPFDFQLDKERFESWSKNGAIVSQAVKDIIDGKYEFKTYNPKAAKKAAELAAKKAASVENNA
jgi:small subunit ribosomal protein S16